MLSRTAAIALRALVELAREPGATLSVAELARRQQLPQPMLEQIVLRLRRAGLLEARRGRLGGYRLAQQAELLPLERVLRAVEPQRGPEAAPAAEPDRVAPGRAVPSEAAPCGEVGSSSGVASLAAGEPEPLGASAGERVEQQLRLRLERLVQRELQRLTLAELLYDQRSWEASLGPEGGVMWS